MISASGQLGSAGSASLDQIDRTTTDAMMRTTYPSMATSPERSGLRPVRSDAGAAPSWLGPELTGVFEGWSRAWYERPTARVRKKKYHPGRSRARHSPHCPPGRGAESARDKLLQELESD